jgi:hypothetical protein
MSAPAAVTMCMIVVGFGCANPSADYQDFRSRVGSTVDSAPATDTAGEASDGSVFDEAGVDGFNGKYWGACLDASYVGDVSKVTYDIFIFNFTKSGATISMSGTRQGLLAAASNISQVVGEVVTLPPTPVTPAGFFAAPVATFISPKEANGFGLDLTVANGLYSFNMVSTDGGCGKFTGKVTSPLTQDVDETCVFARTKADGSFTPFVDTKGFHCP